MKKTTVLTLLAWIGLWFLTGCSGPGDGDGEISKYSLKHLDIDSITTLTIRGKYSVDLSLKNGRWTLKDGRRAESSAVHRALEAMQKIESSTVVTRDAKQFGRFSVDDAQGVRVVASAGEDVVADFVIGTAGAGGSHIRSGATVFSMKGVFSGTFSRPIAAWADRRVVGATLEEIEKVEIFLEGQNPMVLVQTQDEIPVWTMADMSPFPDGFRFDHLAARSVIRTIAGLRAREFVEPKPESSAVFENADRVVVHFKDPSVGSETVILGKHVSKKLVYAKKLPGPDTFIVAAHSAELLRRKALDYRDLRVMKFNPADVVQLEVKQGELSFTLKRSGEFWQLGTSSPPVPDNFNVSQERVVQFLENIRERRAAGIVENSSQKFGQKSKSTELTLRDGTQLRLEYGAHFRLGDSEAVYVRGNADDSLYYLPRALVQDVQRDLASVTQVARANQSPPGNIDPASLNQLPPEVREQLLNQIQEETRKQEMLRAYEQQNLVR